MKKCFFEKILLPVDRSEHSRRAVNFAGLLLSKMENILPEVTLFHVITGQHLSEILKSIHLKEKDIKDYEFFKKSKEKYIKEFIEPFLNEYAEILKEAGFKGEIKQEIEEGDAGNKIIEITKEQKFSAIMMSRRGMSEIKSLILGGVSNKVICSLKNQNIYIVGQKIYEENHCPVPYILIPVDGSEYSMKAVEHSACLAKFVKGIKTITILRVVNISLYLERIRQGIDPEEEAKDILIKAQNVFLKEGISPELIKTKILVGLPAEEIVRDIQEHNYNLVIMGRKGRSALKSLIFGGVSSAVINRCLEPTVAIINM
ncbi:universal stress protein [Thermodesulfovibrio yellowstonii]|uniref:universal stress protein n=1 Tax=Thermodesulfovibrio yellowstonii TaxID=28262 RepID=UPI0024B3AAEB|nr:universal stress protein [Thermodesulfovibrio yellowstonii]MDI6865545.1 universal stress protein [Thermodesulfovibrio yellowstonii]